MAPRATYVPQVPVLFTDSVRQKISLGRPYSIQEVQRAAEQSMLAGDLAQLEHGLDTAVGTGGILLSGGQVQRCAAARALVLRPMRLCVDNLSSAVNVMTERAMWMRSSPTAYSP